MPGFISNTNKDTGVNKTKRKNKLSRVTLSPFLPYIFQRDLYEAYLNVSINKNQLLIAKLCINKLFNSFPLPLKDLSRNRKIEFGFTFQNIQTVFDSFKILPAYI